MDPKMTTAYIDRIEEVEDGVDKAVLYIGEETDEMIKLVLPVTLLPENAVEGDYVTIAISIENADDEDVANDEKISDDDKVANDDDKVANDDDKVANDDGKISDDGKNADDDGKISDDGKDADDSKTAEE